MDNKRPPVWRKKLILTVVYAFLLLGGMSLAYAAGQGSSTALLVEVGSLQAQVNQNEYRNYHNTKSEYAASKERLEGLLAEVREKLEVASSSDVFYLQYQITSYESQIEEVDKKLRDATLQEMLYEYYESNYELIIAKEVDKAGYIDYQNAWKLELYEEQLRYLKLAREEAAARYDIAVAKRDMGYALETEVTETRLALEGLDIQYNYIVEEEQFVSSELLAGERPDLSRTIPSIQMETHYYQNYLENSATYKYYINQAAAYVEYGNTLKNTASPSDAEQIAAEGAQIRVKLARTQQLQYEQKIEEYIHGLVSTYRAAKKQYDLKVQEKYLCEEKQKRADMLYRQGEIQHVDLLALEVQYAKLEYEALDYLRQASEAQYKLKHCIEE